MPTAEASHTLALTVGNAKRSTKKGVVLGLVVAFPVLFFVAYPLLWLAMAAVGMPQALTGKHIVSLVSNLANFEALKNTLILASGVGVMSIIFGVPVAWATACTNMPCRRFIHALIGLTFILPPYLTALAYVFLLGPNAGQLNKLVAWAFGLDRGPVNIFSMGGVIFVICVHSFTFVYFLANNAFRSLNSSAIEAARVLGASRLLIARRVVLPMVTPAISSGALLAALESCALFGPQAFLGLPASIIFLPTRIWGAFNTYPPRVGDAGAMSLVLIFFAAALLFAQQRFVRRGSFVTVSGKEGASIQMKLGAGKWVLLGLCLTIVFFSAIAPLLMFLQAAFSKVWTEGLLPSNLTLDNFASALKAQDGLALRGFVNSFKLAVSAATIATILGLMIAYLNLRTDLPGRRALDYLSTLPMSVPGNALAVALILAFIRPPILIYGTAWILLVAYIVAFMPSAVRCADAALRQLDPTLEEAARITGASWASMMRSILVPILKPALLIGWLLVFIPSLIDLSATVMLYSSGNETLSIAIYRLNEIGRIEDVAALSLVIISMVLVASIALYSITERSTAKIGGTNQTVPAT